ncbi:MAG TPA: SMC family ATPase [Blastocatellia bacterium]|nr:SMC family ATPase [Blastocatellia bacterium]
MLITKVELENIKSYEEAAFEFGPGVTAISGPNGAGKTTILEAIAWALFDQLPYKKEDFLRRGTRRGSVRVSFLSVQDGREYTVYRDTGAGYYVYDPITKLRLVEQKNQVGVWLRQHLGVDAGTDLKTLFTSTIGVPQGTFTVDFAEQPAKRKVGFDKVLRVDEYHRSAEDLRALIRLVESRDANLREEIARLGGEVSRLDELLKEKTKLETEANHLESELRDSQQERERTKTELEHLDELKRMIERLAQESSALYSRLEEGERRHERAVQEVNHSRQAAAAVAASAEGFAIYNEANARLAELEPKAAERDALKKDLSDNEREASRLDGLLQGQREKLKQIEADRVELVRLIPFVDEQEKLEARKAELQTALGEGTALRAREAELERELSALRSEYSSITKQIDEAEKLKEIAERVPALEDARRALEQELSEARVQLERISERKKELNRTKEAIAKLSAEIKTIENEINAAADDEKLAALLPQLELEDERLMEEIAHLRASIEREKKILAQIKGGLCPLLAEPCLNMKEGQSLDQYFKAQVGNESERLTTLELSRKESQRRLAEAKAAMKKASSISAQRVHHERYVQELDIERKNAARLEGEVASASVTEKSVRSLSERLKLIEGELRDAQAARSKYEKLDLLRDRQAQLKNEGSEKKKASEDIKSRLAALGTLNDELSDVEQRLAALEDPRGRARALKRELEKEPEVRRALEDMERRERAVAEVIKNLMAQLEVFSHLDHQLAIERERRAASEKDHRVYIENQPIAAMLDARETELAALERELEENRSQRESVETELQTARAEYDEQQHNSLKVRLEELTNQVVRIESELKTANTRLSELENEIERLVAIRRRMAELNSHRERCQQLLEVSDFIRDLLRKAGPYITEAHLQSISIEANQLFREIAGNPMVSLRWDTGYEIILEEDGHERPFASLSGGEQMAAALAVRLALLKELSDLRIAFFDEPTTNMDEERRRNLAQQIGRIKDFDQLFVISHDDAFEGFTDQLVTVGGGTEGGR